MKQFIFAALNLQRQLNVFENYMYIELIWCVISEVQHPRVEHREPNMTVITTVNKLCAGRLGI